MSSATGRKANETQRNRDLRTWVGNWSRLGELAAVVAQAGPGAACCRAPGYTWLAMATWHSSGIVPSAALAAIRTPAQASPSP